MRKRVPGLDLLRALAIAMVVLYHTLPLLVLVRPASFFWWLKGGRLGVDLFFVLSGFLIGNIILETGGRFSEARILAGFLIGRWLRTLPAYYLFLGFYVLLYRNIFPWPFHSWWQFTPYLWFTQNFRGRMPLFFVESWSLSVEEWFYLLMPFALWAALRAGASFLKSFGLLLGLMLIIPIALRSEVKTVTDWHQDIANIVIYRFDAIGWGIAAVLVQQMQPALWERGRRMALLVGLGVTLGCYLYVARAELNEGWFVRVILPTLIPVGFALILPSAVSMASLGGGWGERSIVALARWSYSLYLINIPMLLLVFIQIEPRLPRNHGSALLAVLIYWLGCVAVSAAMWRLFEKPIWQMRARVGLCREAMAARVGSAMTG